MAAHYETAKSLGDAVMRIGEPPCEKHERCEHYDRCAQGGLACQAFRHWVLRRRNKVSQRVPTEQEYRLVYRADDPPPLFDEKAQKRARQRKNERALIRSLQEKQRVLGSRAGAS